MRRRWWLALSIWYKAPVTSDRILPEDALTFIQQCVHQRKIRWTYHLNMRLRERGISRSEILDSIANFEIIEEYPDDKYLPSYQVYAQLRGVVFHVLFAVDVAQDHVRVITAYRPDPQKWADDLKTRSDR